MNEDRVIGTTEHVAGKIEKTVGDATGAAATSTDGRSLEAEGFAQNLAGKTKDILFETVGDATALAETAYINTRFGKKIIEHKISSHPFKAVFIAGGVGYLLAHLLKGRNPK